MTSVLVIKCEVSVIFLTVPSVGVSQNEGQPDPESNLVSDKNSSLPHTTHLYTPAFLLFTSSPVNALRKVK